MSALERNEACGNPGFPEPLQLRVRGRPRRQLVPRSSHEHDGRRLEATREPGQLDVGRKRAGPENELIRARTSQRQPPGHRGDALREPQHAEPDRSSGRRPHEVVQRVEVGDLVGNLVVPILTGHPRRAHPRRLVVRRRRAVEVESGQRFRRDDEPRGRGHPLERREKGLRQLSVAVTDHPHLGHVRARLAQRVVPGRPRHAQMMRLHRRRHVRGFTSRF